MFFVWFGCFVFGCLVKFCDVYKSDVIIMLAGTLKNMVELALVNKSESVMNAAVPLSCRYSYCSAVSFLILTVGLYLSS